MTSSTAPTPPTALQPEAEPMRAAPPLSAGIGPTRVAVVGAGFIADFHLEILAATEGVELVGVCDLDAERARRAAERFGARRSASDLEELPSWGTQVAHVLVPPEHHGGVVRRLIELGIGAFVEKPLALSSDEARQLTELAARRGVPLGVNHNACHHPAFARLFAGVRAGRIGRVEHVRACLSVPLRQLDAGDASHWMFRSPRNIVFEQAPHPFSQIVELAGSVREMHAELLGTRPLANGKPFHDRWLLSARAERATVEVYLAFGQGFTRNTIEVLGSDGMLEADLHHDFVSGETKTQWLEFWNTFLAGWRRGGQLRRSALRTLFFWSRQTLGLGQREDAFYAGMRGSIRDFHERVRAGRRPRTDGAHGVAVLEWCEAAVANVVDPAPLPPLEPSVAPAREGEVCVLGAAGFIGRQTLAALAERGLPTTALLRRTHSLPGELDGAIRDGSVRLALASLEDGKALEEATRGARGVVHLATGGGDDWEAIERSMVQGTVRVAEACLANDVERLIYVSSTAALYLGHDAGPAVLLDDVPADPEPEGRALYARGKIAAEEALLRLHRERGLRVTIVRPAIVLGPGTPLQHSGIGLWTRDNHCVGWGLGHRPLPLVLASDVADALARLAAFEGTSLDGRSLNLSARQTASAADVVATYRDATGRDFHFHPRPLWVSQAMELGKWVVKRIGGRKVAPPSYRDLKSREMVPTLACHTARDILGWRPCDDAAEILRATIGDNASAR